MISKREFANVVNQVNGRFDWFTQKVESLQAEIDQLKAEAIPVTDKKKPAAKKAAKQEGAE